MTYNIINLKEHLIKIIGPNIISSSLKNPNKKYITVSCNTCNSLYEIQEESQKKNKTKNNENTHGFLVFRQKLFGVYQ